jgi:hypothetical protein
MSLAPVVPESPLSGARILCAIKENQLLTAAALFILWQLDLFNSVIGYGCGL